MTALSLAALGGSGYIVEWEDGWQRELRTAEWRYQRSVRNLTPVERLFVHDPRERVLAQTHPGEIAARIALTTFFGALAATLILSWNLVTTFWKRMVPTISRWHIGKLVLVWLGSVAITVFILVLEEPEMALFVGAVLMVIAFAMTWTWLTAREGGGKHKKSDPAPE